MKLCKIQCECNIHSLNSQYDFDILLNLTGFNPLDFAGGAYGNVNSITVIINITDLYCLSFCMNIA